MAQSIQPGSVIARYTVVERLGAGGMGEVYLARDESLQRTVALKILPPHLITNDERVRRFIQEAKAASALSHPHIVTIHEIGEAVVQPPHRGVAADAAPVRYIAMELVDGHTVRELIHVEKTELKTLIGYLAQAADGIAKAHAAGIVHRDLKPENIMVTRDGYAKVLDFGLAKLTEARLPGAEPEANVQTVTAKGTGEGVILGTVGYMSPEQVQGKVVDARSDIFSFGCVLYEAATRHRPFQADSDLEVLHKILKEKPPLIEDVNPQVPGEVRRLIRRSLEKNPDQRLQSAKDLAIELREIADDYDSLTLASASGSGSANALRAAVIPASRRPRWLAPAAFVIGVAGLGLGAWGIFGGPSSGVSDRAGVFQSMSMTRVATIPDLVDAALSPDARHLAFARREARGVSLWMRQLATSSDVPILPAQEDFIYGLALPGDGTYLYYLLEHPTNLHMTTLMQVPAFGGSPRRILENVAEQPAFSPDNREVAFIRVDINSRRTDLVVASLDGVAPERILAGATVFDGGLSVPAWSPDGSRIAVAVYGKPSGGALEDGIATVDVKTGTQTPIGLARWRGVTHIAWLPDGSGLVLSAVEREGGQQLWLVSYPSGKPARLTNDTNTYIRVDVSSDSRTIGAVQTRRSTSIWTSPAAAPNQATELSLGPGRQPRGFFLTSGRGGTLILQATEQNRGGIWRVDASSTATRLTPDGFNTIGRLLTDRDGAIYFCNQGTDVMGHIWRMNADGSGLRQITAGPGEFPLALVPEGLLHWRADVPGLWRIPFSGGEATKVSDEDMDDVALSPDGRYLLEAVLAGEPGRMRRRVTIVRVDGGDRRTLQVPERAPGLKWARTSDALTYFLTENGVSSIWKLPIDGGKPSRMTSFTSGELADYAWSDDGKRLYFSRRGKSENDVVLITNFR